MAGTINPAKEEDRGPPPRGMQGSYASTVGHQRRSYQMMKRNAIVVTIVKYGGVVVNLDNVFLGDVMERVKENVTYENFIRREPF